MLSPSTTWKRLAHNPRRPLALLPPASVLLPGARESMSLRDWRHNLDGRTSRTHEIRHHYAHANPFPRLCENSRLSEESLPATPRRVRMLREDRLGCLHPQAQTPAPPSN